MTEPSLPSVTVTILTLNGECFLDAILTAIEEQKYSGDVETLVIDSGSIDGTLGIVGSHPSARLHTIPNEQFGHGKTRNLAAQLATGDIVVYLTQDAVPADDRWLSELAAPFIDDPRIVAVFGKQVPRPAAPPVLKYDIQRVFERLGPDFGITVVWDTGGSMGGNARAAAAFYSDANSAARRDILLGPVPYRDVPYAEDQLFGRDLFNQGFRKAYAPRAAVEHSNDVTLRTFGRRITDEVVGLRQIGTDVPPVSRIAAIKQFVKWSTADAASILLDPEYSVPRKFYWLIVNPWYHVAKWRAYRKSTRLSVRRLDD
ncbi:MAG: glycosyltransferase family 2 protein [Demequinaceae bacterium]|nr:glycosyltransferase family 2 protein [Demequinaceae bacterium]